MTTVEAYKILWELKYDTKQALENRLYGKKIEDGEYEKRIEALDIALKELCK